LEPKLALLKTKPKIKKAVTNNAILIDLYNKIQESKQQHQKIFNLSDIFTDPHFLISCYNQIKIKSGNMTPGISKKNLDGIDHKSLFNIASDLKSGKFVYYQPSENQHFQVAHTVLDLVNLFIQHFSLFIL